MGLLNKIRKTRACKRLADIAECASYALQEPYDPFAKVTKEQMARMTEIVELLRHTIDNLETLREGRYPSPPNDLYKRVFNFYMLFNNQEYQRYTWPAKSFLGLILKDISRDPLYYYNPWVSHPDRIKWQGDTLVAICSDINAYLATI